MFRSLVQWVAYLDIQSLHEQRRGHVQTLLAPWNALYVCSKVLLAAGVRILFAKSSGSLTLCAVNSGLLILYGANSDVRKSFVMNPGLQMFIAVILCLLLSE